MYVICQPNGLKRPVLLRVKDASAATKIGVVPDHTMYGERQTYKFTSKDVIVPLGDTPPYGSAYGVLVEPVVSRQLVRGWGEIFYYVKMPDAVVARVNNAFVKTYAAMKKSGMGGWHTPVVTHIRNPKGKNLASYHYRPQDVDHLTLRPSVSMSTREMAKAISHEGAHGHWMRNMTSAERASWISLYNTFVAVKSVSTSDIKRMLRDMRQASGVRPFLKECEPEEQASVNIYLGWLKKVHGLAAREVEDLVANGSSIPVPDTHLHRSSVAMPITLYSKESPTEMFAEAASSYIVGDLADKRMQKMLRRFKR